MYFPYLKGRKYELLAIKELLDKNRLSLNVIPIIEPLSLSSDLINTFNEFSKRENKLSIVLNPQDGEFVEEYKRDLQESLVGKLYEGVDENKNLIFSTLVTSNYRSQDNFYNDFSDDKLITICLSKDDLQGYIKYFSTKNTLYNLIPNGEDYKRTVNGRPVKFVDSFNKLKRNADYKDNDDELFSDNHLNYKIDNYVGFADYSVIGQVYDKQTGGPAKAVAIHIVYFDKNDNLRIHHFVSDSNDTTEDLAGKFQEALVKLIDWDSRTTNNTTLAMNEFRKLYSQEKFPGLGKLKQLSIMHHLELMGQYLDKLSG
ncbi:sce7725 family protein [Streptococcus mutans]|uniref:sce7725 family protein n=1 Tax=Streptococcus mutans TaxID=1309 RepID=UPI0002B5E96F|nr:sce7725 family protein [Streptococcus mutans]EMB80161.1 hypothetical protein SMU44_03797 [Streptococcus mutans 11VS1]EMC59589.1 hypothetical protein SMU108_01312 [Streptococcus mutans M230]MDT9553144.1 sce7725 family protein [Streptococcus mutans]MDT9572901.1 sce7725 family protein [Streptococcus mutans]NLQ99752.1 hypothetical protein [Streptococcus mutans]